MWNDFQWYIDNSMIWKHEPPHDIIPVSIISTYLPEAADKYLSYFERVDVSFCGGLTAAKRIPVSFYIFYYHY